MTRIDFPRLPETIKTRTVQGLLRDAEISSPDKTALIAPSRMENREISLSYSSLAKQARVLAGYLLDRGVAKGSRVGIMFDNRGTIEARIAYHAAHYIGAIPFPINTRYVKRELGYIIEFSKPAAIIFDSDYAQLINSLESTGTVSALVETANIPHIGVSLDTVFRKHDEIRASIDVFEDDEADSYIRPVIQKRSPLDSGLRS